MPDAGEGKDMTANHRFGEIARKGSRDMAVDVKVGDAETAVAHAQASPAQTSQGTGLFSSPLLWGGLLTIGFYSVIPYLPFQRGLAERYFCSHPLEYATTALFFTGMAILGSKWLRIGTERSVLASGLLDFEELSTISDAPERAARVDETIGKIPGHYRSTHLSRRIHNVCSFILGRKTSSGLEEHLKYLAELASERLHESFALIRTITWAVPILGFLGTVIGITIAIANVTPEQLDSSLNEVTGGLAVAFDTTALALALSLVLVFAAFIVERSEQTVLVRVEEYGTEQIVRLFPPQLELDRPLIAAEKQAADELIRRTEAMIRWQTQLWGEALESMRGRWTQTLSEQKQRLDQSVQKGVELTLADHAHQLKKTRDEFLESFRSATTDLTNGLRGQSDSVTDSLAGWQTALETSAGAINGQLGELQSQGETLSRIVDQETHLARLEERLAENLQTVQTSGAFEETLHNINAAIHLLTARTQSKAA
jgi:biopolymer transport protein ExbB/TolQ